MAFSSAQLLPWRRALVPAASTASIAACAIRVDHGASPRDFLAGGLALALVVALSRRPNAVVRVLGWGLATTIASLAAEDDVLLLRSLAMLGAILCAACGSVALSQIEREAGLLRTARPSPRLPVAFMVLAFSCVASSSLTTHGGHLARALGDPSVAPWVVVVAGAVALGAFVEVTARRCRLELGMTVRVGAVRAALVALCLAAALVAAFGEARPVTVALLALCSAGAIATAASIRADAVRVSRATRRGIVLAIACGSLALLGAAAAEGSGDVWTVTVVVGLGCAVVGSMASTLEGPLRPAGGVWLDAFARALEASSGPEPEDVIRDVLKELRAPHGLEVPSPELWTFAPPRCLSVDAAGYLHEEEGDFPEALPFFALGEPHATLRRDVLQALEVRVPSIRPLAKWMEARNAMAATAFASDGDLEGVLVLPKGSREEALTLEEVTELKRVADGLAASCQARAGQTRMLERSQDAERRAAEAEWRVTRLRQEQALDAGRDALASARLARPAAVGFYSAASRSALESLEARTRAGTSIAVVAPSGVDPVPYLACAHLGGARRSAPLVLVDGTSAREHDPSNWLSPTESPLALGHRGLLVLLDGAALPLEIQQLIARATAERRAPWERPEPIDVQLALSGTASPEHLMAQGRLDPSLAMRLGEARSAPVTLPRLSERVADLRSILTDRLAREGLRAFGRPVGIDHAAYARLVEYAFPGEDAELSTIVQRLVACSTGDVVRAADVDLVLRPPDMRRRKDPLSA